MVPLINKRVGCAFLIVAAAIESLAQIGDKAGEPQAVLVPSELIPLSPALTAADELKTFQVAPGFHVELVAAEPLVGDPVAMAFSPDGRLWVVEMRGYMPDLDGHGEDAPVGRVVVLSDKNGDGQMETSEVFLDGLIMPRAITLAYGGVLIGAPPMLWFCRDNDHDGKADEKIAVASDYGVQVDPNRPEVANPERAPNSLLWALDNWIYSGAYTARFRMREGRWERDTTTFRGQWGLSQDDWGHLFYNSNSDQLRADVVPARYLGRNPNAARLAGCNVNVAANQFVWPARVNPGINRGYRPEMLREFKLKEFTAACAPWIYRGDLFPKEFYGNAFVCDPAGNLIKRNIVGSAQGSLSAREAYDHSEFLASTDERFRPVNLTTGPDGALYIVDLYRGVIQHRISLTTYLRNQIEARGLDKPIGLGRIWRVMPDDSGLKTTTPEPATAAGWAALLSHPNGWWRETAQRLLVEKGGSVVAIEEVAIHGKQPLGRMHALWTLDGMRALRWPVVANSLDDPDPRVRVAALRTGEIFLGSQYRPDLLDRWIRMAGTESVPEVQLQLALSLGEARDFAADLAMAELALRANPESFLVDAVLSGMAGRELELLEKLLAAQGPSQPVLCLGLARSVFSERKPARVERLLELLAELPPGKNAARITLLGALKGSTKKPIKFSAAPEALAKLIKTMPADSPLISQLIAMLTWPGRSDTPLEVPIDPLSPEEKARFENGKLLFAGMCAACHQPHGRGVEGLAPPLVDSEWVQGSVERLCRIVLNGVRGPIKVNGASYSLDMPAMNFFNNEQIADILTYVRREWDHRADPVSAKSVARIRTAVSTRQDAWTEAELLKIP